MQFSIDEADANQTGRLIKILSLALSALRSGSKAADVEAGIAQALAGSTDALRELEHVSDVLPRVLAEIERGGTPTTPTGFAHLDGQLGGGLAAGELHVLAARPRMGKSALATGIAANISRDRPVLVFSLEMSAEEQTKRVLSQMAGRLHPANMMDLTSAEGEISERLLWWCDKPLGVHEIARVCRQHAQRYGQIGLVVVDYLQIVPGTESDNRAVEVGRISGALKRLAMLLETPIVSLAQLNRKVEERPFGKPRLSDLRESGSIEQDADAVWLLWRPEVYTEKPEARIVGKARVEVAKQRRGPEGRLWLSWEGERFRFADLPQQEWPKKVSNDD